MKLLLLISILFSFSILHAKTISRDYSFKSYQQATDAKYFVKFNMESTKAGIITTGFTGHLKKFNITTNASINTFINTKITFEGKDLDTDSGSRDEKMFEETLNIKKYPTIQIDIPSMVKIGEKNIVNAKMQIRGKIKDVKIEITATIEGGLTVLTGRMDVKISELELPDPSIFIASVRDLIEIRFKVAIQP